MASNVFVTIIVTVSVMTEVSTESSIGQATGFAMIICRFEVIQPHQYARAITTTPPSESMASIILKVLNNLTHVYYLGLDLGEYQHIFLHEEEEEEEEEEEGPGLEDLLYLVQPTVGVMVVVVKAGFL
ncbi:hypothetical protein BDN71DRAFT_1431805 [Pleurotus eryngii]|uniref:Uncharacterized protein n=1 Tax=Pleurotus eryngii TaxID=5323 RepID=A0A9P5ZZ88_PLEER|nr:hypothetical protein BDN71DRAFT_1431805 [Pleurotus eryngii]